MAMTGIKDLDLEILMNLPDRDLLNYCSTNKDIYNMCNNDMFWRKRFIKRFGEIPAKYKPKERKWKNHYMQVVIDLDRFSSDPWRFLRHILYDRSPEFSKFIEYGPGRSRDEGETAYLTPFLKAPEWVMTNFYLLEIPRFEYKGVKYPTITPSKLFEIIFKDIKHPVYKTYIHGDSMYSTGLYRY